jgi:hypothetical protein
MPIAQFGSKLDKPSLASSCLEIFLLGSYGNSSSDECYPTWLRIMAQVSAESPILTSALASFASAYIARFAARTPTWNQIALQRRQTALRGMIKSIQRKDFSRPGFFLASIVLATCEALFWNMTDALAHIRAAFALWQHDVSMSGVLLKAEGSSNKKQRVEAAELDELARSVDLHIASYRLGQAPELPTAKIPRLNGLLQSNCGSEATLILLNACYEFTSRASLYKYSPNLDSSYNALLEQQSSLAALLRDHLSRFSPSYDSIKETESTNTRRRSSLVVQCLSSLIYLSTILNPFELAYDSFTECFAEIVQRSAVLTKNELDLRLGSLSDCPRLRFQPGLFQPLYLTAMKCRHPRIRRKAIDLFSAVGVEGPWDFGVMEAIAQQAIKYEEDNPSSFVPEAKRLHGCGVYVLETDSYGSPSTVEVEFSSCKDVNVLIAAPPEDQSSYWNIWREKVIITPTNQFQTKRIRIQG